MQNLSPRYLEVDEIWTYCAKKQRRIRKTETPDEIGDQYIFVSIDADTKLIPSFCIGKRTAKTTYKFVEDLYARMAPAHRAQLTTDGYIFYRSAVPDSFGTDVDFAQLTKLFNYGQLDTPDARYSPPRITEVISKVYQGHPDPERISTSYIERQNLTMRMQMRRLTRFTNAYSKKLANLKAAVALHFAFYNFCRVHSSLRVSPAVEAGLTDHIWSVRELLSI